MVEVDGESFIDDVVVIEVKCVVTSLCESGIGGVW